MKFFILIIVITAFTKQLNCLVLNIKEDTRDLWINNKKKYW